MTWKLKITLSQSRKQLNQTDEKNDEAEECNIIETWDNEAMASNEIEQNDFNKMNSNIKVQEEENSYKISKWRLNRECKPNIWCAD